MRENSIGSLFSLRSMGGEACLMALPLPSFFSLLSRFPFGRMFS